jgi:hypothetical protein
MSLERERRVCAALGIDPPTPRRRYWRPCLPAEFTPQQRARVLEFVALVDKTREQIETPKRGK